MGKNYKKQTVAESHPMGVSHQHDPLTRYQRKREKYVTSDLPAPADFDNYMISIRNFTLDQIGRMRLVCNDATLSVLYNHCHATPNLMDTHGFTPADITRIMRIQGAAHNLMAVFHHIDALKAYCDNDKDKIVAMASFTGASCSITAICSDMSATLINTHGFSMAQLVDVVSRAGGKRKFELLHKYAAAILQMNIGHEDIISIVKQAISAEAVELALREKLVSASMANNMLMQPLNVVQLNNSSGDEVQVNIPPLTNQQTLSHVDYPSMDIGFELIDETELFNNSLVDIPPQPTGELFTVQWRMNQQLQQGDEEVLNLGQLFDFSPEFN